MTTSFISGFQWCAPLPSPSLGCLPSLRNSDSLWCGAGKDAFTAAPSFYQQARRGTFREAQPFSHCWELVQRVCIETRKLEIRSPAISWASESGLLMPIVFTDPTQAKASGRLCSLGQSHLGLQDEMEK